MFEKMFLKENIFKSVEYYKKIKSKYFDGKSFLSLEQKKEGLDQYMHQELLRQQRNKYIQEFFENENLKLFRKVWVILSKSKSIQAFDTTSPYFSSNKNSNQSVFVSIINNYLL